MNITMDKKYTYTNGESARILCVDCPNTQFPVISMDGSGRIHYHTTNGSNEWTTINLIEIWTPQDKEPVWAWDNEDYGKFGRVLQFYDLKNKCLFDPRGQRDGPTYNNYAKVELIEQWMLDVQTKLEE